VGPAYVRIEPSPPNSSAPLPSHSPRQANSNGRSFQNQARSFQAVQVPTGPRSQVPQTRPSSSHNALDPDSRDREEQKEEEPIIVIEEERDPEKVLEERRKKREEIMAKFKANGPKAAATPPVTNVPLGTGADSVNSGVHTADKGGIMTGTTTGVSLSMVQESR